MFINFLIKQQMNSSFVEKYSKLQWAPQEQGLLKELKEVENMKSWKSIASIINQKFPHKNRNGKQCRQRYMNYVRFTQQTPKILDWNEDDDILLFESFLEFGAKWVQISKHMPGRSQNCLKNRFYGALRKIIRKINKIQKQKKLKYKKSIKYDSLMKILSYKTEQGQSMSNLHLELSKFDFIRKLRKDLICLAISQQQQIQTNQILSLIVRIHDFNCIGRTNISQKIVKQSSQSIAEQSDIMTAPKHVCRWSSISIPVSQQATDQKVRTQSQTQAKQQGQFELQQSFLQFINQDNIKYLNRPKQLEEQICEILHMKYIPDYFCFI